MAPKLSGGIDHVHVYVSSRAEAEEWYASVLGFLRDKKYEAWADDPHGPLTIQNPEGTIHLALFQTGKPTDDKVAFGASGEEFLAWRAHFESMSVEVRLTDHDMSYSLYFSDPDGNVHEITTYDPDYVRQRLTEGTEPGSFDNTRRRSPPGVVE